jgi:hypothetical protein
MVTSFVGTAKVATPDGKGIGRRWEPTPLTRFVVDSKLRILGRWRVHRLIYRHVGSALYSNLHPYPRDHLRFHNGMCGRASDNREGLHGDNND